MVVRDYRVVNAWTLANLSILISARFGNLVQSSTCLHTTMSSCFDCPAEIGRIVFELAASDSTNTAYNLLFVSREVRNWYARLHPASLPFCWCLPLQDWTDTISKTWPYWNYHQKSLQFVPLLAKQQPILRWHCPRITLVGAWSI